MVERLDRKNLDIHSRELAQLKQTGSSESYISEFKKLAVTVTDISEQRLVMLFVEGLVEPLRVDQGLQTWHIVGGHHQDSRYGRCNTKGEDSTHTTNPSEGQGQEDISEGRNQEALIG